MSTPDTPSPVTTPAGTDPAGGGVDLRALWRQASIVSGYYLKGTADNVIVGVCNGDLRRLDDVTHALSPTPPETTGSGVSQAIQQAAGRVETSPGTAFLRAAVEKRAALSPTPPGGDDAALVVNHEEALELAQMKQRESNLARCYMALAARIEALTGEVERLTTDAKRQDRAYDRLTCELQNAQAALTEAQARAEKLEAALGRIAREDRWRAIDGRPARILRDGPFAKIARDTLASIRPEREDTGHG